MKMKNKWLKEKLEESFDSTKKFAFLSVMFGLSSLFVIDNANGYTCIYSATMFFLLFVITESLFLSTLILTKMLKMKKGVIND